MEAFHPSQLEKHHHHHHHHHQPPVEFLQGAGRYGAKSHGASGNAFNSWNDYLGLATLITKAVSQEKGFRTGPSSVVVQQVQAAEEGDEEEEEEEEEEDEEEEEEEEDAGAPYFENALDLRHFGLCGHHHHHHGHHHHLSPGESLLEERFADFSPFSGRSSPASVVFSCSADHLERDRSPHAWGGGGRLVLDGGRLQQAPPSRSGSSRLLKPELQVCVFCRNNKEAVALYTTHILKGPDGRVLCPVLRRYTCPLCGASGDNAHTIKYCPLSKMHGGGPKQPLKSSRHILGKKLR